jgi:formylglycine-generating enzyme required for sulfatase activity
MAPNPFGLVNMLGNVREFCLDWYGDETYGNRVGEGPVVDPRGPDTGEEHVVRGGSFRSDPAELRAAARDFTRTDACLLTDPQIPKSIWWYSDCNDIGFRVVRELKGAER